MLKSLDVCNRNLLHKEIVVDTVCSILMCCNSLFPLLLYYEEELLKFVAISISGLPPMVNSGTTENSKSIFLTLKILL